VARSNCGHVKEFRCSRLSLAKGGGGGEKKKEKRREGHDKLVLLATALAMVSVNDREKGEKGGSKAPPPPSFSPWISLSGSDDHND